MFLNTETQKKKETKKIHQQDNTMNDYQNRGNGNRNFCYFHPKQVIVGVCPFCLDERLVVIAAEQQGRKGSSSSSRGERRPLNSYNSVHSLPTKSKIFALGSLLNRLEIHGRHHRSSEDHFDGASDDFSTCSSLEDSFISIKFEDNGIALWDHKGEVSKVSDDLGHGYCSSSYNNKAKSLVESTMEPHGTLRWKNRVGHLLELVSWRRSHKTSTSSLSSNALVVDEVGVVKVGKNKGRIRRALTRRSKEE